MILAAEESYYIGQKVITYAGVPHTGCHEMWVCPAFWPHFSQKVKKYIEKYNKRRLRRRPKGAGASRPPPWGAAEGGALLFSIFGWIFVADALFMLLIFHWATGLFA